VDGCERREGSSVNNKCLDLYIVRGSWWTLGTVIDISLARPDKFANQVGVPSGSSCLLASPERWALKVAIDDLSSVARGGRQDAWINGWQLQGVRPKEHQEVM